MADKRREVAARQADRSRAGGAAALRPAVRSLEAALRGGRTSFILECKRMAPSAGILRRDLDVGAAVRTYAGHGDAVSVLTDGPRFGGALADLGAAAAAATLPVLAKDFILAPSQVEEARRHGADAILLMLAVLDDAAWRACHAAAAAVGMDVLTEVHDEAELERALALGAPIVGLNNRDLRTMTVDLAVTERLAPRVPADRLLVCESGITSHRDVVRLRDKVDAFLVGTALMRAASLSRAVRELIYGVTKVCGLASAADARAAAAAGATHGGLVFSAMSPRRVSLEGARAVRGAADVAWAGVFMNQSAEEVALHATRLDLAVVQLNGDEQPGYIAALRPLLPVGCEVWKRVRVRTVPPPLAATGADRLLIECEVTGARGRAVDWRLLGGYPDADRCVVSCGLTPDDAGAADRLGVWGLDVSMDGRPGAMGAEDLAAFFGARRGHGRERRASCA